MHEYICMHARRHIYNVYICFVDTCKLFRELMVAGIISMEDGKQGSAELQETRISTWELSVSSFSYFLQQLIITYI